MADLTKTRFASLHDLKAESNSHQSGIKRVFVNREMTNSALTQFAHGTLTTGQESGFHSHATMDEYFYFIDGNGEYVISDNVVAATAETFIRIPAGSVHNLRNVGDTDLVFVYFGIAL